MGFHLLWIYIYIYIYLAPKKLFTGILFFFEKAKDVKKEYFLQF